MGVNLSTVGPGSPGITPQILEAAQLAQASKYASLATLAAATWNWIVSLGSEYRTISKSSPIKFLYLVSRYVGLATAGIIIAAVMGDVEISICDRISTAVVSLAVISTIAVESILCFRTCALWGNNRSIVAICVSIVSIEAALMIYSVTTWIGNALPPGIVGCFPGPDPTRKWTNLLFWAPPCVVDAIFFALTAFKVVQLWRQSAEGTPILALVIRDGVLYFFWVFLINLVNLICFAQANLGIGPLVGALAVVMPTVLCCRTVLNLRAHTGLTHSDSHITPSHWTNGKLAHRQRGSHFVSAQGHELQSAGNHQGIAGAFHVDITKATATSYEADGGWGKEGKMGV